MPRQPNALPVFLARHPLVLDVEESDGDLMGDGVNIAARLEGVCEPGEICLSEDAYRQVKGRLDLAVTDLGQTQLKNIAEPIRVYSLRVGVSAQAKPAMPTAPPAPKKRSALTPRAVRIAAFLILSPHGGSSMRTGPLLSLLRRRPRQRDSPLLSCPSPICPTIRRRIT